MLNSPRHFSVDELNDEIVDTLNEAKNQMNYLFKIMEHMSGPVELERAKNLLLYLETQLMRYLMIRTNDYPNPVNEVIKDNPYPLICPSCGREERGPKDKEGTIFTVICKCGIKTEYTVDKDNKFIPGLQIPIPPFDLAYLQACGVL